MLGRRRRISGNGHRNFSLPHCRDGSGSAETNSSSKASWERGTGQQQLPQRDPLDHFNYFDVKASTLTTLTSQLSNNHDDDQIRVQATPSSLIPSDAFSFDYPLSQYIEANDGFMSHSSPESATWQPGEVLTPNSSHMGSQYEDVPLADGLPGSYGSLNSFPSSSPETMASKFPENFGILDTSPPWGSPLSNGRTLEDLSMPSMFTTSFIARMWWCGYYVWKFKTSVGRRPLEALFRNIGVNK